MIFIILLLAICFIAFRWWLESPRHRGKVGEAKVHNILCRLPEGYHILDDVVFITESGTTQIDHLVVSKYGVFAIETKNYRGEIYGDDNRDNWTQVIKTNVVFRKKWWKTYTYITKNQFYSPVKQALNHIFVVKAKLPVWPHLSIIPIVVFAGDADLSNITSKYHVVAARDLLTTIQHHQTVYLSDDDVQRVVDQLIMRNVRDVVSDKTHIRNIKAAKKAVEAKVQAGICPRCGGTLVKRAGQYGRFYGCSNYPNCTFTIR